MCPVGIMKDYEGLFSPRCRCRQTAPGVGSARRDGPTQARQLLPPPAGRLKLRVQVSQGKVRSQGCASAAGVATAWRSQVT